MMLCINPCWPNKRLSFWPSLSLSGLGLGSSAKQHVADSPGYMSLFGLLFWACLGFYLLPSGHATDNTIITSLFGPKKDSFGLKMTFILAMFRVLRSSAKQPATDAAANTAMFCAKMTFILATFQDSGSKGFCPTGRNGTLLCIRHCLAGSAFYFGHSIGF